MPADVCRTINAHRGFERHGCASSRCLNVICLLYSSAFLSGAFAIVCAQHAVHSAVKNAKLSLLHFDFLLSDSLFHGG